MVFIIPREWWGARPARATFKIKTPTPELWLHHAAGAMLPGDDQVSPIDYQRIRAIQNFHMDKRGWNDIAYSWLVDTDGYVFEGRGPGIAGGHTAGHNTVSHAICVMGNYDIQTPDPDLLPRIAELVRYTHSQGWTPKVFSGGHRDVGATSCPGSKLYPLLPELNRLILEDDMTPEQAATLARIEDKLDALPVATWSVKVKRTRDLDGNLTPNGIAAIQELADSKTLLLRQGAVDIDEDALVAQIVEAFGDVGAQAIADKLREILAD